MSVHQPEETQEVGVDLVAERMLSAIRGVVEAWSADQQRRAAALEPIAAAWEDCAAEISRVQADSWEDAARGLERCLARADDTVMRPLLQTIIEQDAGTCFEALARNVVEAARRTASEVDSGESDTESAGLAAFANHMAEYRLPNLMERIVTDEARAVLLAHARLASEATRWTRVTVRGLETAQRYVVMPPETPADADAADGTSTATSRGEVAAPVAGHDAADPGAGDAADEVPPATDAAEVESLRQRWERRLLEAGDALVDAIRGIPAAAAVDRQARIIEAIDAEVRAQLESFDTRAGRRRVRATRTGDESSEAEDAPVEEWLAKLALTRRFSAETARLQLLAEFVSLEAYLVRFPRQVLLEAADSAVIDAAGKLTAAATRIREIAAETEGTLTDGGFDPPPNVLRLLRSARGAITVATRGVEKIVENEQVERGTAEGLGALMTRIGSAPGALLVAPLLEPDETPRLKVEGKELDLRAWVKDAFGPALLDRLSAAADPCQNAIEAALGSVPQAIDILEYNLGAASSREEFPKDEADALQAELILGGLNRTADLLEESVTALGDSRTAARRTAVDLVRDSARKLRDRAEAEAGVAGQAKDVLDAVRRSGRRRVGEVGRSWDEVVGKGRAYARLVAGRLARLVGRAQSAVGVTTSEVQEEHTTRVISELDTSAADLPFIYRRLFSYRALDDPTLLVGRDAEVRALDDHLERWEAGSATGLLLVGTSGVGVSSLLKTTRERWYGRVDWREVEISDRIEDEATLAGLLGRALGIEPTPTSLADLEAALLGREKPAIPVVCALENLEHLYFRGVLARGLIAPMLKLVSATDPVVLWLASIPSSAWEVVKATDPGLSALMRIVPLASLDREEVEAAVRARHQRSGIPIEFEESSTMPLVARRALSKARDEAARRAVIEKAFFDRVFQLSEGHVALAMLYWLRSVQIDAESGNMTARWPEPLDFSAWDGLPPAAAFGLRAFLEHGTLTTVEYARLFGVSETVGFAMFERLGGMLMIEAAGDYRRAGTPLSFERVDPSRRYRIRPVLVRPVERLLTSRRLLY